MKILVNHQLVEYKDEGKGKVILLLHGWGVNLNTFDDISNHLSKKFRVIRFDFPGFGNSPKPNDDWFVGDYAEFTRDFLKKIKIDEIFAIIAHSFGGRVTIKGVSSKYINPQKLVFIGVAGVKPPKTFKKTIYKMVAKVGKIATSLPLVNKIQPILKKQLYISAGSTDYLVSGNMKKIFLNTINEDLLPEVHKIKQNTLLIWGEDDTETPLGDAKLILKSLSSGRLVVVPNTGHFVYTEAYEKVAKELDNFLR